jgi:hypothetical protein
MREVVGVICGRKLVRWMARSDPALALDVREVVREQAQQLTVSR